MRIEPVTRVLDAAAVPFALIGAHAMAARVYPRFTIDVTNVEARLGDARTDREAASYFRNDSMNCRGLMTATPRRDRSGT